MSSGNSLTREEFASEEAIARNLERLKRLGDGGQTPGMFEAEEAAEYARKAQSVARGDDLPLFAS